MASSGFSTFSYKNWNLVSKLGSCVIHRIIQLITKLTATFVIITWRINCVNYEKKLDVWKNYMNISFYIRQFWYSTLLCTNQIVFSRVTWWSGFGSVVKAYKSNFKLFSQQNMIFLQDNKGHGEWLFRDRRNHHRNGKFWLERRWKWNILKFDDWILITELEFALKRLPWLLIHIFFIQIVMMMYVPLSPLFHVFQTKSLTLSFTYKHVLSNLQVHVWYFLFISAVWVKKICFFYKRYRIKVKWRVIRKPFSFYMSCVCGGKDIFTLLVAV